MKYVIKNWHILWSQICKIRTQNKKLTKNRKKKREWKEIQKMLKGMSLKYWEAFFGLF